MEPLSDVMRILSDIDHFVKLIIFDTIINIFNKDKH